MIALTFAAFLATLTWMHFERQRQTALVQRAQILRRAAHEQTLARTRRQHALLYTAETWGGDLLERGRAAARAGALALQAEHRSLSLRRAACAVGA